MTLRAAKLAATACVALSFQTSCTAPELELDDIAAASLVTTVPDAGQTPLHAAASTTECDVEAHLLPGESIRLSHGAFECIGIAGAIGAVYLLAYFDPTSLGVELGLRPDDVLEIWLGIGDQLREPSTPTALSHGGDAAQPRGSRRSEPVKPCLHSPPILNRGFSRLALSLTDGDTVTVELEIGSPLHVRVLKGMGGFRFVYPLADPALTANLESKHLNTALTFLEGELIPYFESVFGIPPRSSAISGQYLILLDGAPGRTRCNGSRACVIRTSDAPRGSARGGPTSYMVVDIESAGSTAALVAILAHELTHAWQHELLSGRARDDCFPAPPRRDLEGMATFLEYEALRMYFEADLRMKGEPRVAADALADSLITTLAAGQTRGFLALGYGQSAAFLWSVYREQLRPERGGEWRTLEQVSRGMLEGWYGTHAIDGPLACSEVRGLTCRVRELGRRDWDPVEAVLEWTVDEGRKSLRAEVTPPTDGMVEMLDELHRGNSTGTWRSDAMVSLDQTGPWRIVRPRGSTGFSVVSDPGGGGVLSMRANHGGIEYLLYRER
jgi:hypothetical protein